MYKLYCSTFSFLLSISAKPKIGVTGFEPAASASRTKEHSKFEPENHWSECDSDERLHQLLHQLSAEDKRKLLNLLLEELNMK